MRPRVLKLYGVVRTAHLERLGSHSSVTLLYRRRKYDFHHESAQGHDVRRAGALRALVWALQHPVDVIEISEPLIAREAARSLAAVLGNRIRAAVTGRPRARIVTYAISSIAPAREVAGLPLRARLRWRGQWLLVPLVWRQVDRVAFGTELAIAVYTAAVGSRFPEHRYFAAVPAARGVGDADTPREPRLVFLGELSERKGLPQLLRSWPAVRERVPGATLTVLGKGKWESAVRSLAARDDAVTARIDPEREEIFSELSESKVLVLPSQPTLRWREQVGLPIVEGLSSGCLIVTTDQTGIAAWLADHGHTIVGAGPEALAPAIAAALESDRSPRSVLADLPPIDGRLSAEQWLLEALP